MEEKICKKLKRSKEKKNPKNDLDYVKKKKTNVPYP
jgi:hypothetical protein